jgi:hypothetical protein
VATLALARASYALGSLPDVRDNYLRYHSGTPRATALATSSMSLHEVAIVKGMVASWTIDAPGRTVFVKFSGLLAFSDLQTYIAGLRASPFFDSNFSELVDLTDVTATELNYGKSAVLSEGADPFSRTSRRAFVVVNEAIHHVVRMYQSLREDGSGIRAFGTVEEAKRWLESGPAS